MTAALNRRTVALVAWWLVLLGCALVVWHTRFVADLSAFMPKLPTQRQQMLADQLRDGIVARLIMVGIEGGSARQRADWSRDLALRLREDAAFLGVQNGDEASQEKDRAYFFQQRYRLSPTVSAERFTPDGLRAAIGESLAQLAGDTGVLLKHLFARDPTAETLSLLDQMAGVDQPRQAEGVWVSRDGQRSVLILQTRAAGSDLDAQAHAQARIRAAFAAVPAKSADARLLMSGAGVFSVSSRQTIEREVHVLATAGFALVTVLLLVVFRSVRLLWVAALPIVTGALAGVAAVSAVFGQVHGLTLAFGTTLIGEAVDYAIYLFVQQAGGHRSGHFWRTIQLGVLTSIAGFAALMFSSFPGLAQLGVYSISGLVAAVLVTRYVLPHLMPRRAALPRLLGLADAMQAARTWARRRLRWLPWLLAIACAGVIAQQPAVWNDQLSGVNPTSKAEQALDASLRADLGAPDLRYVVSFVAADEQAALRQAERVGEVLGHLVNQQVLSGYNSPAMALPSLERQKQQNAQLPEESLLQKSLQIALAELPVKAATLAPFVADVQATRTGPLLTRTDLAGTSAAMLVDSLMVPREGGYRVLLPLRAVGQPTQGQAVDVARVERAFAQAGLGGVGVIDVVDETRQVFAHYLHEALMMAGLGVLGVWVLLVVSLRSPRSIGRLTLALGCAVLAVAAGLLLAGQRLTILHLVGLLLVVAVGSNYALFFEAGVGDGGADARRQTLVSLLVANLTTVGGFGLLAFSNVPVLAAVGMTVAPGALMALLLSAIVCGDEPGSDVEPGTEVAPA